MTIIIKEWILLNYSGSHKKVVRAVKLLREFAIPFRIGTVKSKSCSVGKPDRDTEYRIGNPDNPRISGRADFDQYNFEMFKQKAITKATKSRPLDKKNISLHVSGHQCFMRDIYIDTNLNVFPCVMERRLKYGNLKNDDIRDLFDNTFRFLTKDKIKGCQDCEYRYECFDCRPDSNGRGIYEKPWYCSYNPKKGERANLAELYSYLKKRSIQEKAQLTEIPIVIETS